MESARSYPLRIIIAAVFILSAGFYVGFKSADLVINRYHKRLTRYPAVADSIMIKRMHAIRESRTAGKDSYEFETAGPSPIAGSQ